MAGSVYSYRITSCRAECGGSDTRKCPKGRRDHTRWGFVVDQGWKWEPAKGRRVRDQNRKAGFERRIDAEHALEELLPAIRAGTAPSAADRALTIGDYLDRWLRSDPNWRPSTLANRRNDIDCYIKPGIGHIRLVDLRSDHIAALLGLMSEGKLRPKHARRGPDGHLSPTTIRHVHSTLRAALNQAVRERRVSWNPAVAVRPPSPARPVIRTWTPQEVSAFLAEAQEVRPDLAVGFMLAAYRGLRRGEVVGLRWSDIDLDAGTARIERNVTEQGQQIHVGQPKTERGKRTVSLGPRMVAALRAHRKAQAAQRLATADWEDHDLVLPDERGGLLWPHVLSLEFQRIAKGVEGLPGLHFHALRHTAATHMLQAGIAPKTVQDQLGHATLAMTMDVYGHVIQQQRDESAEAAERLYEQNQ